MNTNTEVLSHCFMIDGFDGVDEFYDTAGDPDQSLHLDPAEQVGASRAGGHLH